ncbi:hypothetical protein ABPG72_004778 [Tetrahymena utriculariae]
MKPQQNLSKNCLICYSKLSKSAKNYFKLKECSHKFHKECLINYIQRVESNQKYNCCPNCKKLYNSEKVLKQSSQLECNVQCVICYQPYTQESIPCSLPCNHFFHRDCLIKWGESCKSESSPCPYCRKMYQEKDLQIRWDVFAKLQKLGADEIQSSQQEDDNSTSTISSVSLDLSQNESSTNRSDITSFEDQITGVQLQDNLSKLSENKSEKSNYSQNEQSVTAKSQQINNNQTQNKGLKQSNQIENSASSSKLEIILEENLNIQSSQNTKKSENNQQEPKIVNKIDDNQQNKSFQSSNNQKFQNINEYSIFVQDLNGQSFILNVSQRLNVKEFAKMVSKKSNIESEQLRFTCQGKGFSVQNNPDELLGNLKVVKNSTVHMLLKLKGGFNYEQILFY